MKCLEGYIGIKGCSTPPDSGIYVNSLPGINLQGIDNMADNEQLSYQGVWTDVQERSLNSFNTALDAAMSAKYKLVTPAQTINIGDYVDTANNQTAASAQYRGLQFQTFNPSPFQILHVQELKIYSKAVETGVVIKIYSVSNDDLFFELDSFTKDFAVGWNTFFINKDYFGQQLFIGYASAGIESPYTGVPNWDDGCGCGAWNWSGADIYLQGATSTAVNGTQIATGSNTYGMSGVFSIRCSYAAFVCNNKSIFAQALLYLLGAQLMVERQYSPRLNQYVTIDNKKAVELEERFTFEYEKAFKQAVQSIYISQDNCIECNAAIRSQFYTP